MFPVWSAAVTADQVFGGMAVSEFGEEGEAPQRLVWTRPVLEDLGDLGSVLGGAGANTENSSGQSS